MTNSNINYLSSAFSFIRAIKVILLTSFALSSSPTSAANEIKSYNNYSQTALGQAFTNHLHLEYDIVQDPEINHYIRSIGKKIVQQTNSNKRFRFYIINNPDINAFAGPDGVIGIHTGLIQSVSSEDELASVIAHEIAHVTQDHLYRRMVLQSESTVPQIASLIAAILIGIHDTSAGMATLMGSSAYQIEKQLKYSRLHEYEADFAGIKFLSLSGYDPHAMPDFFEKLATSYQHQGASAPEILRTHPLTENRLAKAQARAASLASPTKKQDNTPLNLIKARLEQLYQITSNRPYKKQQSEELNCYQTSLKQLSLQGSDIKLTPCLHKLINSNSPEYLYHALMLEVLAKKNVLEGPTKPITIQTQLSYELFPMNESIVIRYAELLESKNKIAEAITELKKFSQTSEYNNLVETMISKLYIRTGETAHSYYHLALAQLNIGNTQRAAIYAEKAKTSAPANNKVFDEQVAQLLEKLTKLLKNSLDN